MGSVSVQGTLGDAGSISVVSRNDVWFPFAAFDPSYDTMPLSAFEPIVHRVFARPAGVAWKKS